MKKKNFRLNPHATEVKLLVLILALTEVRQRPKPPPENRQGGRQGFDSDLSVRVSS